MTRIIIVAFIFLFALNINAQERTIGLVQYNEEVEAGYYLFSPKNVKETFLINECGEKINTWTSIYNVGNIEYFMPDGNLLRGGNPGATVLAGAGGKGGRLEMFDWDNNLIWEYTVDDSTQLAHHEFRVMPNGNILVLAWDYHSTEEALASGRDTASITGDAIWSEKITEIKPLLPDSAEIVWEWKLWDHLVQDRGVLIDNYGEISEHPELLDINKFRSTGPDWIHANSLDYNPDLDQILFCSRDLNEFYVIDHSTTTEEAADHTGGLRGKGGDFLFRWGNQLVYEQGDTTDQVLFDPHGVNWIDAGLPDEGDILIFNCGKNRPVDDYTNILKITPSMNVDSSYVITDSKFALDDMQIVYEADPREDFFASFLSGVQQLPSGNYMISDGPHGTLFEVDAAQETYWKYIVPVGDRELLSQGDSVPPRNSSSLMNFMFRSAKYDSEFTGFNGKDLSVKGFVELDPLESLCETTDTTTAVELNEFLGNVGIYPNPIQSGTRLILEQSIPDNGLESILIMSLDGRAVSAQWKVEAIQYNEYQLSSNIAPGVYLMKFDFESDNKPVIRKLVIY